MARKKALFAVRSLDWSFVGLTFAGSLRELAFNIDEAYEPGRAEFQIIDAKNISTDFRKKWRGWKRHDPGSQFFDVGDNFDKFPELALKLDGWVALDKIADDDPELLRLLAACSL